MLVAIGIAKTLAEVEDLYRPYKQKKRTRAIIAKEKGLDSLAAIIIEQKETKDILEIAAEYINEEKKVESAEDAIAGAKDIIAEDISDNAKYRKYIKSACYRDALIETKASKEDEKSNYEMYYEFSEEIKKIPSHRILAINRERKKNS